MQNKQSRRLLSPLCNNPENQPISDLQNRLSNPICLLHSQPKNSEQSRLKQRKSKILMFSEFLRIRSAILMIVLSSVFLTCPVQGAESQKINEQQLLEDIKQGPNTFNYFNFQVGMRYFSGTEYLVIKVIADEYNSDPDLFISKRNKFPQDSSNSEWTCQKKGSDTCIINSGQITVGDTFNIGVKCKSACSYKLFTQYAQMKTVVENTREQVRYSRYSTNLLKFYIPSQITEKTRLMKTISASLKVEPEDSQSFIEMFVSTDKHFNLLEDRQLVQVVDNGMGVKFTQKDIGWCTKCWIYFVVNVYKDERYYVTTQADYQTQEVTKLSSKEVIINPFQQECFKYIAMRKARDVVFWIQEYSGHADTYLAIIEEAKGPTDKLVLFRDIHGPNRQIVLERNIRDWFGAITGNWYLCFYARSPFSASVRVDEIDYAGTFEFEENQMMTAVVAETSSFKAKMTTANFKYEANMYLYLQAQDWNQTEGTPDLFYKVCKYDAFIDCMLSDDDFELFKVNLDNTATGIFNGTVRHYPSDCPDASKCTYFFKIANPSKSKRVFSLKVQVEVYNPQDVNLKFQYANVVQFGEFINYEINPISNKDIQPLISKLSITVETMIGDSDLFVSFSRANPTMHNFDYQSREVQSINQVTLIEREKDWLNRPIFFSIFGNSKSEVIIRFAYEFRPGTTQVLQSAIKLGESAHLQQQIIDEQETRLYQYTPWWTGGEKRSIVFLADMINNKVFFVAQWNDYPRHFKTNLVDENDAIAVFPENQHYHFTGGHYFILLRPDFALWDMMTWRFYDFNMIAFSQAPCADENQPVVRFEDIELGRVYFGFIRSNQYQDFRYLQVDMDTNYEIRIRRIPQRGKPKFYVKTTDEGPKAGSRENDYHYESKPDEEKPQSRQYLKLTPDMRNTRWPQCRSYQRSMQTSGKLRCFISIGVTCEDNKECAFNLTVTQVKNHTNSTDPIELLNADRQPPMTLTKTHYVNSKVAKDETKYFMFPFDAGQQKDVRVLLNKTQIFGTGQNGNCKMMATLQSRIDNPFYAYYKVWKYPTDQDNELESNSGRFDLPEVISPSVDMIDNKCQNQGCALIIGVTGLTDEIASFRLKAFEGTNMLKLTVPVDRTTVQDQIGSDIYDYFWFTIPPSQDSFEYQISVSTQGQTTQGFNNPNLFLSLNDGRKPTKDDYDLQSSMQGADAVFLNDKLSIWAENNWDPKRETMVMVGVQRDSLQVPYQLLMSTMQDFQSITIKRIKMNDPVLITEKKDGKKQRVFMFYNWEHKDFNINILPQKGDVTVSYQKIGQNDYQNNIFTAVPLNKQLAQASLQVKEGSDGNMAIKGNQCYQCWYFILIEVSNPNDANYRLLLSTVLEVNPQGSKLPEIFLDVPIQTYIPSGYFDVRKFKLESMENWVLEVLVANGAVEIYVSLDLQTLGPKKYIWTTSSQDGIARLEVQTTDINFHMSTDYFVQIQSVGGMDAIVSLTLKQSKVIHFLTHNHDSTFVQTAPVFNDAILFQKFQYQTDQEIMKRHVFQVPGKSGNSMQYYRVHIIIEALTPHFYPMVYLIKQESDKQILDFSGLRYPDLQKQDLSFGENPFIGLNQKRFEFVFEDGTAKAWAYYTMAIYEHNWGLIDIRKSEYQIRIIADKISSLSPANTPVVMAPYSPPLTLLQN